MAARLADLMVAQLVAMMVGKKAERLAAILDGRMVGKSVVLSVVLKAGSRVDQWAVKSADTTADRKVEMSVVL